MRRVSSRQRLVSWDAADTFQANQPINTSSHSSQEEDSYDDLQSSTASSQSAASKAALFLVTAMTKKRKRRIVHVIPNDDNDDLPGLPQDVWCHIYDYLDKPELQVMLQANLSHRLSIIRHRSLWRDLCLRQWPWIPPQQLDVNKTRDWLRLSWAPVGPSRILENDTVQVDDYRSARYTGSQRGDRCIRADRPLCCSARGPVLRPTFSNNINNNNNTDDTTLTLSPSICSYFEITVAPQTQSNPATQNDCIAIGVATEDFVLQGRQPGWDTCSYGWHGDDGGLFHGAGSMRQPLETFGPGDTVGCGIWVSSGSGRARLVFTKNGRYLGAPFLLTSSKRRQDWYPVVGIDSPHRVSCNFGASPFQWDFQKKSSVSKR